LRDKQSKPKLVVAPRDSSQLIQYSDAIHSLKDGESTESALDQENEQRKKPCQVRKELFLSFFEDKTISSPLHSSLLEIIHICMKDYNYGVSVESASRIVVQVQCIESEISTFQSSVFEGLTSLLQENNVPYEQEVLEDIINVRFAENLKPRFDQSDWETLCCNSPHPSVYRVCSHSPSEH
jgi:hypothetical protein